MRGVRKSCAEAVEILKISIKVAAMRTNFHYVTLFLKQLDHIYYGLVPKIGVK